MKRWKTMKEGMMKEGTMKEGPMKEGTMKEGTKKEGSVKGRIEEGPRQAFVCPQIIHFLPGQGKEVASWREHNPDFLIVEWTKEQLSSLVKNIAYLENLCLRTDDSEDTIVFSAIILYLFGGIVVNEPLACHAAISEFLSTVPSALMIMVEAEGTGYDFSLSISTGKISAFMSLFKVLAGKKGKYADIYSQFISQSMNASQAGAIVGLSSKDDILGNSRNLVTESIINKDVQTLLLSAGEKSFAVQNHTNFSKEIREFLLKNDYTQNLDMNQNSVGILILDDNAFDVQKPVSASLDAVVFMQKFDTELLLVNHSPSGGIGMDMMMRPQLSIMQAAEIFRDNFVIYRFPSKNK